MMMFRIMRVTSTTSHEAQNMLPLTSGNMFSCATYISSQFSRENTTATCNLKPQPANEHTCYMCARRSCSTMVREHAHSLSLSFFFYAKLSCRPRRARAGMRGRMQKSIGIRVVDALVHARTHACAERVPGKWLARNLMSVRGDLLRWFLWCCDVLGESFVLLTRLICSVFFRLYSINRYTLLMAN